MANPQKFITIKGARENNLQDINLTVPKNKLVVFTGVSGSGKSSLAFQTIYEEGRRRYIESLSAYARQFLGNSRKPDVDTIEGLAPAVAIEQKTTHNNPRSTVGTTTEIYDFLRLLYARIGVPHCPTHKKPIAAQSPRHIFQTITALPNDTRLVLLSPVVAKQRGTHVNLLAQLRRDGFLRVRIDGTIYSLDDTINLQRTHHHNIEIVVDRLQNTPANHDRLADGLEIALDYGKGVVYVQRNNGDTLTFSRNLSCPKGDFDCPNITPQFLSFNSPAGMCPTCKGIGVEMRLNPDILIPDRSLSIAEGAVVYYKSLGVTRNLEWQTFCTLLKHAKIDMNAPFSDLTDEQVKTVLWGTKDNVSYTLHSRSGNTYRKYAPIEGVGSIITRHYVETSSEHVRTFYKQFMSEVVCHKCRGSRLNAFALAVYVGQKNIYDFTRLSVSEGLSFLRTLRLNANAVRIGHLILNELENRLSFLENVGLNYLTLNRKAETLSGGEAQRIRLATQIGAHLAGVLYVLDEPTIGLHQKDNARLVKTLRKMVDNGNTLIVVEHDLETIRSADHVVEIGPGAGAAGGKIVVQGTPNKVGDTASSITGQYLSGEKRILVPAKRRSGNKKHLFVQGASENNLKNVNVRFPLGKFTVVTGVSGSGKSSLVNEVLSKALLRYLSRPTLVPGKHKAVQGLNLVDKVVRISQSPIGRTPRSNPATYTSVFTDIRTVFANTLLSRERGYMPGRFSFNVANGRCDKCQGDGYRRIEMHFLPDVFITCEDCGGKRYNRETLQVKYRHKNIADVLAMSVEEAHKFFFHVPQIKQKLSTIMAVGLNYIKLGQPATTLSGGEAQRVKLATYLQKKPTGKTVYVLDEPTTGLHTHDVVNLLQVLNQIVNGGDTVILIEHNLEVIKVADHIIDLGPEGGAKGGFVIASGTPEQVSKNPASVTGQYLKRILK